jgi:alanyl-tRNA synthetase
MNDVYPELESHREFIEKMVTLEEERFGSTLTVGLNKLDELFATTKRAMPEYKALARLYDTFGTPRDLIRVGLEERGFAIGRSIQRPL